jgi:capsular polysaccharide biosynthesis protein
MGVYLLALALSLVAVAIGARMRHTVETPWDIEAIADAPVLGTVPVHDFAAPLPERMRGFS